MYTDQTQILSISKSQIPQSQISENIRFGERYCANNFFAHYFFAYGAQVFLFCDKIA